MVSKTINPGTKIFQNVTIAFRIATPKTDRDKTDQVATIVFKTVMNAAAKTVFSRAAKETSVFKAKKTAAVTKAATIVFRAATVETIATIVSANRAENFNRETINFKAKSRFSRKENRPSRGKMNAINRESFLICR